MNTILVISGCIGFEKVVNLKSKIRNWYYPLITIYHRSTCEFFICFLNVIRLFILSPYDGRRAVDIG